MPPVPYARHRFPPGFIQHAIRLNLRFTLNDREDLLAERGAELPCGTMRRGR
ncbi:MAG: hypothetical protein ICV73_23735 [Acetobacteraceae bacterium]|nr:hypothetical protein [Acetobacteraceae bacterium]